MGKEAILNGISKAVTEAINKAEPGHKVAAAINAIGTSVRITFIDGQFGKNSMQFNVEPDGLLTLHNLRLPSSLRKKGVVTNALREIRKLPGLNGYCHVAFALDREGWKTILQRAGFNMV